MLLSKYKQKINYLINRKKNNAGRNNTGHITVAHQGGGHKQFYRKVMFKGNFSKGFVVGLEYDPNRSANLAKICSSITNSTINLKKYYYILAPKNLKILDTIESSSQETNFLGNNLDYTTISKQVGNCYYLHEFSVGDYIYNVEISLNKGGQFVRAGGTSALILQKINDEVSVKLPSGEHRLIPNMCRAFYGNLSNDDHNKIIWRKAGKSRWLNIRPTVRGVAKNPIDHPHGGNTSGGRHHMTPWSKLTKGQPTRSKKKSNKRIIKYYKNRQTI